MREYLKNNKKEFIMYAIMGSSGHIGHELAKNLLENGSQVKAICRHKEKIQDLKGVTPCIGDIKDLNFLTETFKGCTGIFCMIPPDYQASNMRSNQGVFGEIILKAILHSGCNKVVVLSSVGAENDRPTGPVKGLFDFEQKLSALKKVDIVFLRPTYFLENLMANLELIKTKGIMGSAIKGNVPFFSIATRDIANRASKLLLDKNFKGHSHQYLLGTKETNMEEITAKFSKGIGKNLKYVQFSYTDAKAAMMGMGFSEDAANNMIELSKAVNDGTLFKFIEKDNSFTETDPEKFAEIYIKPLV